MDREGHGGGGSSELGGLGAAMVVLLVLAVAVLVVTPRLFRRTCEGGNETAAVATLWNLISTQEEFREARLVDLDGDGRGEFGTFLEMTGSIGLRADANGTTRGPTLHPAILSPSLATVNAAGVVTKAGYAFAIFLPGKGGPWVRESGGAWTSPPKSGG
jgi:type II secretory pathway pseudopilin PulG